MALHVINTDILLYNLRAFENKTQDSVYHGSYPNVVIKKIKEIALKPRAEYREIKEIADKFNLSSIGVRATISKVRAHGYNPKYWDCV